MEFAMQLSLIADEGDVVCVRCEGEISNAFHEHNEPLEGLLGSDAPKRKVLLNLEKVRFVDSSGISWLLSRHREFSASGGRLVLYEVPPLIRQPLEFVKLTRVLHIAADEAAARTTAGGGQP
jgi:anti-anti-sigma factor